MQVTQICIRMELTKFPPFILRKVVGIGIEEMRVYCFAEAFICIS